MINKKKLFSFCEKAKLIYFFPRALFPQNDANKNDEEYSKKRLKKDICLSYFLSSSICIYVFSSDVILFVKAISKYILLLLRFFIITHLALLKAIQTTLRYKSLKNASIQCGEQISKFWICNQSFLLKILF